MNHSLERLEFLKPIIDQRVAAYRFFLKQQANKAKHLQQDQQRNMEIQRQRALENQRQERTRRESQSVSDDRYDVALKQIQAMKKQQDSSGDSIKSSFSQTTLTPTLMNELSSAASVHSSTASIDYPNTNFEPSVVPKTQLQEVSNASNPPPVPPQPEMYAAYHKLKDAKSSIRAPPNSMPLTSPDTGPHRPSSIYSFVDSTYRLPAVLAPPTPRTYTPESLPASNQSQIPAPDTTAVSKSSSSERRHEIRAYTEGKEPLRSVFLPATLRTDFLKIADPNTRRHLETCGMLCGVLTRNAFFITHLLIPHQESTSDTCQTTHEEYLFEYLDKHNLILIGWIHTHPTQSCFMSSVDLHTQSSYQLMLKESIAIVCAPTSNPSWDIYRLTDPKGVNVIKECPKSSFHPHPENDIYASSRDCGHVTLVNQMPFKIVDLRSITPDI